MTDADRYLSLSDRLAAAKRRGERSRVRAIEAELRALTLRMLERANAAKRFTGRAA